MDLVTQNYSLSVCMSLGHNWSQGLPTFSTVLWILIVDMW